MTVKYVDFENGNDANDGLSFANRKKTLASASSGMGSGDEVRVMASPDIVAMGQNATWTNNSQFVTLASAVTQTITNCDSAWTGALNVTSTASTSTFRQGTASANLSIASAFLTGLVAYFATGSLNLSAYEQVSFLVRASSAKGAGVFTLRLCSDTMGLTAVHTITLPALSSGNWHTVVWDNAAALSSGVQSVALYAESDPGVVTINLDNILACKAASAADCLTHNSLISKNTAGEPWFAIDSIDGTTIDLGTGSADRSQKSLGGTIQCLYFGTTETVAISKRQPILLAASESASSSIKYTFGWDRTAMSSQNSVTWARTVDPSATVLNANTASVDIDGFYPIAPAGVGVIANSGSVIRNVGAAACAYAIQMQQGRNNRVLSGTFFMGCATVLLVANNPNGRDWIFNAEKIWGSGAWLYSYSIYCTESSPSYMAAITLKIGQERNSSRAIMVNYPSFSDIKIRESDIQSIIETPGDVTAYKSVLGSFSIKYNIIRQHAIGGDNTNHKIRWNDVSVSEISSDTSVRHTESGISWKFSPKGSSVSSDFPLSLCVAKIACAVSEARTVKLWFIRSSTDLAMRLRLPGGQIAGVSSDVSSSITAAANTWEQLTVNFTPTEVGVVEVFAEAWGGISNNGWVDDLEVS